jgi:AcrR family transcriptional regulator
LDRAIEVFWRNGYEGASVAELSQAMGINPPSLYAAFGNKEGLFRRALDRYVTHRGGYWDTALAAPTAREMVESLLSGCVDFLSQTCNPPGCLFVRSAASCSEAADKIHEELTKRRKDAEKRVRERLERGKEAGELPADFDPAGFTRYLLTVLDGMSMHAAHGAKRAELRTIADTALRAWPS